MDSLKSHYRLLLGLDKSWEVTNVELNLASKSVTISLEYRGQGGVCPECNAQCGLKDHGPERRWRHLDTMQFETILLARIPRANCSTCGVKTMTVPWGDKHSRFTLMFEAFAIDVLICAGNVKAAAALLGLSWDSAHAIIESAVERGLVQRDLDGIRYLGIDEKSFGQGQDYVSVMTDTEGSRVIEVAPGRTGESADILWNSLSETQRSSVAAVSMDMWQVYESSVERHAPQAEIVFDRFHISKHLNEALDKVRRTEHRELMKEGDTRLKGTRQLLLYNPENLEGEREAALNALHKEQLRTNRAWGLKDYFRWFWMEADADAGREFFNHWYNWAILRVFPDRSALHRISLDDVLRRTIGIESDSLHARQYKRVPVGLQGRGAKTRQYRHDMRHRVGLRQIRQVIASVTTFRDQPIKQPLESVGRGEAFPTAKRSNVSWADAMVRR